METQTFYMKLVISAAETGNSTVEKTKQLAKAVILHVLKEDLKNEEIAGSIVSKVEQILEEKTGKSAIIMYT